MASTARSRSATRSGCTSMRCGSGCSGVDDGEGRAYGTEVTYEENRVRIRIGDADRTIQGPARFRIRYRVERAILWEGNRAWGERDRIRIAPCSDGTPRGRSGACRSAGRAVTVRLPRDARRRHN